MARANAWRIFVGEGVVLVTKHGFRPTLLAGFLLVLAAHPTTPLWAETGQPLPSCSSDGTAEPLVRGGLSCRDRFRIALSSPILAELELPRLVPKRSSLDLPFWFERARWGTFGSAVELATKPILVSSPSKLWPGERSERIRARLFGACLLAARFAAEDEVDIRFRIRLFR